MTAKAFDSIIGLAQIMPSPSHCFVFCLVLAVTPCAANVITFGGQITQSTADGTGPASNNPALNGISDGDPFTVTVTLPGTVSGLGSYNPLPGATVAFTDASISETAFASAFLTVSADADPSLYDISFLACLSTGSGCNVGNSLSANFAVAAADFGSASASAGAIAGLYPPVDLLEDDGITDIQGTVTNFSNAPEPSAAFAAILGLTCCLALKARRRKVFSQAHLLTRAFWRNY